MYPRHNSSTTMVSSFLNMWKCACHDRHHDQDINTTAAHARRLCCCSNMVPPGYPLDEQSATECGTSIYKNMDKRKYLANYVPRRGRDAGQTLTRRPKQRNKLNILHSKCQAQLKYYNVKLQVQSFVTHFRLPLPHQKQAAGIVRTRRTNNAAYMMYKIQHLRPL